MTPAEVVLLAFGLVLLLIVLRVVWSVLSLAIPLILAGIAFLFVADKTQGGTALDQLATRISNWIRSRIGG